MNIVNQLSTGKELEMKIAVKERLPQPEGVFPVHADLHLISFELHGEMQVLPTELGSTLNPKTFAIVKELCKDSEPE